MSGRITRWLLLFLEYEFTIVYELGKTHVVVDVLSKLPNNIELLSVLDHYFFVELMWMHEVKLFKNKLDAKKVKTFILEEGIMYRVGQDNKMHRCLTIVET